MKQYIAAVHAACKKLCIDDDARRALQNEITGKKSLKDMSAQEIGDLLNHINRLSGIKTDGMDQWSMVFKLPADRQPYAKKIFRLAQTIGAKQTPPCVMSVAWVEGIAAQMRGCAQPLAFCSTEQLHKIIQALEIHARRK